MHPGPPVIDRVGRKYGRLTVVALAGKKPGGRWYWVVQCSCNSPPKTVSTSDLSRTKSCGCLADEVRRTNNLRHGMRRTPEYQAWQDMKNRCYRDKTKRFERWGGRGIRVCKKWRNSFEAFYKDVGPRPSPLHTLDRENNDGHYEPGNVRWATPEQQAGNKSNAKLLRYKGRVMCAKAWARELGLKYSLVIVRLRRGWSAYRTLSTPPYDRGQD